MDMHHDTLVFASDFPVPPGRVFEAYADPRQREAWSAPGAGLACVIDETDVRTGGRETARMGHPDTLEYTAHTLYHFVEEGRRIVFTEELWMDGALLTVALVTFDIAPGDDGGTRLTLTDQITSLVGTEGVDGHRDGYGSILDLLSAHLSPAS